MRKYYPYLQDPYLQNLNVESEKYSFLDHISDFVNQRQYVKMTLLTWEEDPVKSIEGEISSGNISKDGNSAIRRTCSLTCAVDGNSYNVENMDMDFTLNRKIFIEIGIKNDSEYYPEYPILWFPQGVFFITSFSMNSSSSASVNLSLGLKDKMAMLNGDVGGMLPGVVRFDAMDTQTKDGVWVEQKVLVYNIISELVNHYGGEDLNNIVIDDVPLRLRKIMKWVGDTPLYGQITSQDTVSGPEIWTFSLNEPDNGVTYTFDYGADVGYIYSDFIIQDELYSNSGDSVCTILDKIKTILGNYEYFYDEMGIFHFREIKNFLNVTQAEFVLDEMTENDYLVETTNSKSLYSFEDSKNITSITVTPNYSNIKNEYIVHGITAGTADTVASNIMYHLVIDKKPIIEEDTYFKDIAYYTDPLDGLNKLTKWLSVNELPSVGNFNIFYNVENDGLYYWDNTLYKKATIITGYAADGTPIEVDPIIYDKYYPKGAAVKLNFELLSSGCWLFMTEFNEFISFNIIVFPVLLPPFMMVRGFISIAASSIGPKLTRDSFNIFSIPLCSLVFWLIQIVASFYGFFHPEADVLCSSAHDPLEFRPIQICKESLHNIGKREVVLAHEVVPQLFNFLVVCIRIINQAVEIAVFI